MTTGRRFGGSHHDVGSAEPVRTCVGCRVKSAKKTLLRLVAVQGDDGPVVVPDHHVRLPGRGAYVHVSATCFDLADRRRAVARALRIAGVLDLSPVRAELEARLCGDVAPSESDHSETNSDTNSDTNDPDEARPSRPSSPHGESRSRPQ